MPRVPLLLPVHLTQLEDRLLRDPSPGFPPSSKQGSEIQLFMSLPLLWFAKHLTEWKTSKRNFRPEGDINNNFIRMCSALPLVLPSPPRWAALRTPARDNRTKQCKNCFCRAVAGGHSGYLSCRISAVHSTEPQLPKKFLQSRTGTSPTAGCNSAGWQQWQSTHNVLNHGLR